MGAEVLRKDDREGKPTQLWRVTDDGTLTITCVWPEDTPDPTEGMMKHFRNDERWKEFHLQQELPLSSLFGSPYGRGESFPYNDETHPKYEKMLRSLSKSGKTRTVVIPLP